MVTIFQSLASAVLAEIARIVAAIITSGIIRFIAGLLTSGGSEIAFAVGAAGGGAARLGAKPPRGETNITIVAFDDRSVLRSLTAPNGALRLALEDAALG
jgi:hypothetical protein